MEDPIKPYASYQSYGKRGPSEKKHEGSACVKNLIYRVIILHHHRLNGSQALRKLEEVIA
jgi:hypothetical protein